MHLKVYMHLNKTYEAIYITSEHLFIYLFTCLSDQYLIKLSAADGTEQIYITAGVQCDNLCDENTVSLNFFALFVY